MAASNSYQPVNSFLLNYLTLLPHCQVYSLLQVAEFDEA
jgi:hypothetical protein